MRCGGLVPRTASLKPGTLNSLRATPAPTTIVVVAGISILLLALAGEPLRANLQWSRSALAAGEWWRLASGHFVHLDIPHASLNVAAMLLLWGLFGRVFPLPKLALIFLIGGTVIDTGLWFFDDVDWYVGLSGLLHAWAAAAVVRLIIDRQDPVAWVIAIFGLGKIIWENTHGALPLTSDPISVVTEVHLFGVLAGMLCGLIFRAAPTRSTDPDVINDRA